MASARRRVVGASALDLVLREVDSERNREAIPVARVLRARVPYSGEEREEHTFGLRDFTVAAVAGPSPGVTVFKTVATLRRAWAIVGYGFTFGDSAASTVLEFGATIYALNSQTRIPVATIRVTPGSGALAGLTDGLGDSQFVGARGEVDFFAVNSDAVPHTVKGIHVSIWGYQAAPTRGGS